MKHAAVLERDGEGRGSRVEYRVAGLGRSIHYVLGYDYGEAPTRSRGSSSRATCSVSFDGRYGFEAENDGTRVTYDLTIDLSMPLPGLIKRRAAGMIMGTALRS